MKANEGEGVRLFAYKQTHDSGFAPNPFHGVCTLATCKPRIRLHKREGDWIAGFTSRRLNGDEVGSERLIYLMQVSERIRLHDYFHDPRFSAKKPRLESNLCIETVGDNLYRRGHGGWVQLPNRSHPPSEMAKDTSGECVLVSSRFAYFGSQPLTIPTRTRPDLPRGQSADGARTRDSAKAKQFIDFVLAHRPRILPRPTNWREGDTSWKRESQCG